jgi:ATP-binding cassette subfamily B protein
MERTNQTPTRRICKQMLFFLKPYYLLVTLRIISTIMKATIDIVTIIYIRDIINSALANDREKLVKSIGFMLLFIGVELVMYFIETYSSGRFSAYVARDMKEKLSEHLIKLPLATVNERHSGDWVSRVNNDITRIEMFLRTGFLDIVFHIFRVTVCLVYLVQLNWLLLASCVLIIILAILVTNKTSKPVKKYAARTQKNLAKVNSVAQDSISGIQMLKAFNLGNVLYEKYKAAVSAALADTLAIEKRNAMLNTVSVIVRLAPTILCFFGGGYLVMKGRLTAGGLVSFVQLLKYLTEGAKNIPQYISNYRQTLGIVEHLMEVFEEKEECMTGNEICINPMLPAVEFKNVSFTYDGKTIVLDCLNFALANSKTTALVGASGSGKSTVLKLLCAFYTSQEGCINVYGKSLNDWSILSLRSMISVVSQDTYLFPATIAENISYGRPGARLEEIMAAAQAAHSHDFIMQLPQGYNTPVGECGTKLSGGQRQRISIARAILKNAPVLLLDEPTSALDTESEALVQQALNTLFNNRTVIVVAHRLSTIKNADEVLVLDQGKIAERGSHQELLAINGIYTQLYSKQIIS